MQLEYTLHAHAVGYLAHGEGGVQAAVAAGDDHTLERLQTLPVAFLYFHLHGDGVTGAELGHIGLQLCLFDFLNQGFLAAHGALLGYWSLYRYSPPSAWCSRM